MNVACLKVNGLQMGLSVADLPAHKNLPHPYPSSNTILLSSEEKTLEKEFPSLQEVAGNTRIPIQLQPKAKQQRIMFKTNDDLNVLNFDKHCSGAAIKQLQREDTNRTSNRFQMEQHYTDRRNKHELQRISQNQGSTSSSASILKAINIYEKNLDPSITRI